MCSRCYQNDGSGGSSRANGDERGTAQDERGSAQDSDESTEEVGDGVGRFKVDGF